MSDQTQEYTRPELSQDEAKNLASVANRIECMPAMKRQRTTFVLVLENAILLKEVNEHRLARGFAPLKVHQ